MNLNINGYNIFGIVIVTFLISVILVPITKKIAYHINALDLPDSRKVHKKPMPRIGGLAIFFSFLAGYMFYGPLTSQMLSIIIGGFIIVVMGLIDDINPIKARYKLLFQIAAAIIVVVYGELFMSEISIFGSVILFPAPINYILTVILIVGIMNAINLIDGLDGLAAGVSSIYFLTIGVIAIILNQFGGLDIILAFLMLGATLGFLMYNFHPASIFMGDTGSLFLGYIISVIALLGFRTATFTSLIIPLIILAVPIFDTLLAIIRRILKREPIGMPDKEHLHHQLLELKLSPRKTVLIIYAFNIIFAVISVFYVLEHTQSAIILYIIAMIILFLFVLKTGVLFGKQRRKQKDEKTT